MDKFLEFLQSHGTKLLGAVQGTVAVLMTIDGIIPATQGKYWLAASAVLTYWRGFVNDSNGNPK